MATTYYPKYSGNSGSITVALKAVGVDSSFANREKIAKVNSIKGYKGMAAQNTTMLNLLKAGKLIKSKKQSTKAATKAKKKKKKKKTKRKNKAFGKWGKLKFQVSPNKKRTFDGLSWQTTINYDKDDKKGLRPKVKFKNIDPDKISMPIRLSVFAGLNPFAELNAIRKEAYEAKSHNLVIGGLRYGTHPMVITGITADCKYYDNKGNLWVCDVKLSFEEKTK